MVEKNKYGQEFQFSNVKQHQQKNPSSLFAQRHKVEQLIYSRKIIYRG